MSAGSPTRRWMTPPPIYETTQLQGPTLKPYLTLPYLLSLTWLAYPIISLLFIAFRLALSSQSAEDGVADAKSQLLASCTAAEKAATVAASLPRYMAIGTNEQIASAVNASMNAAREALVLALTILEAIINFAIDIYRSTFFCFLELVVRGGLSILIEAVQDINSFLSSTFSTIRTSIQNDISSINSAIQTAVDGINKVNPFGNISAPQFDVPDLSSLENVTLPDSVQNSLTSLNSSLPTISQIKDSIQDFVDTPFEDLKVDINNTFAGLQFNQSTLFVPQQDTVSFCDQMDTSVVDDLGRDLVKLTRIGVIILVILALLLIGAHCALEWYKWKCQQMHLEYTRQAWINDPTMNNRVQDGQTASMQLTDHNLLVMSGNMQHPLLTRISNFLSSLLRLTPTQQTNLQWFFHYVFHPPAFACFLIGFLGLLSVELQLAAVKPLEAKYTAQANASVTNFQSTIATSINATMFNQSATYADQINTLVNTTQTTINDGLFGWVNGTTTTLNDTLVTFYSDVQNAISTVFNGTVLESPVQEFVFCLIGSKIEALEDVLTFLHDNLLIQIQPVNQSILVLSPADINEATTPVAQAALGDGTDGSQGVIGKLVARYVASLKTERIMFAIFIALWLFVVLIAILIIVWHSYVRPAIERRKQKKFLQQHRHLSSIGAPFVLNNEGAAYEGKHASEKVITMSNLAPSKNDGLHVVDLRSPTNRLSVYAQHQPQRSWDSLLDASERQAQLGVQPSSNTKAISPPRKLMATGRRGGKERFVSDEERVRNQAEALDDSQEEAKEPGWMKRFTSVFSKQNTSDDSGSNTDSGSNSSSQRPKPNLTIRTDTANRAFVHMKRDQLPTAGGDIPAPTPRVENHPGSAWSISPEQPQRLPWLPTQISTMGKKPRAKRGPGLPLSPRPSQRKNGAGMQALSPVVDIPNKVGDPVSRFGIPGGNVPPPAPTPYSGITYYQSELPQEVRRDSLLPENTLALRIKQKATPSMPSPIQTGVPDARQPGGASAAAAPKSPANLVNPFATPFDDDAGHTVSANPFWSSALDR